MSETSTEQPPASPSPNPPQPRTTPEPDPHRMGGTIQTRGLRVKEGTRSRTKTPTQAPPAQFSAGSESAAAESVSPRPPLPPVTDPITDDAPTSTPSASSPEQVQLNLGIELLREIARGIVASIGEAAHMWLTTSEIERHMSLYLTEETDQKAIGDPLASIARRRLGSNLANPDTADLIKAGIGAFVYAQKNVRRKFAIWRAVRQHQAQHAAGQPQGGPTP